MPNYPDLSRTNKTPVDNLGPMKPGELVFMVSAATLDCSMPGWRAGQMSFKFLGETWMVAGYEASRVVTTLNDEVAEVGHYYVTMRALQVLESASQDGHVMARKLINLKIELERLARIDAEAHRLGMNRTEYIIDRCDPGPGEPVKARPFRGPGGPQIRASAGGPGKPPNQGSGAQPADPKRVLVDVQIGPRTFRPGERLKPR